MYLQVLRERREIELRKIAFHRRFDKGAGILIPGQYLVSSKIAGERPNCESGGARSVRRDFFLPAKFDLSGLC
jgi:hypothetical protein